MIEGLDGLLADLQTAGTRAMDGIYATTAKAALNIKTEAARNAPNRHGSLKLYPKSITYDIERFGRVGVQAEIGPDKDLPQGALGNLIEFGSVHNHAEPSLIPAWEKESETWIKFVSDAAEAAFGG